MTHEQRVYHHLYETLEGILEHSERIAKLEELVIDLYSPYVRYNDKPIDWASIEQRMKDLDIHLDGDD